MFLRASDWTQFSLYSGWVRYQFCHGSYLKKAGIWEFDDTNSCVWYIREICTKAVANSNTLAPKFSSFYSWGFWLCIRLWEENMWNQILREVAFSALSIGRGYVCGKILWHNARIWRNWIPTLVLCCLLCPSLLFGFAICKLRLIWIERNFWFVIRAGHKLLLDFKLFFLEGLLLYLGRLNSSNNRFNDSFTGFI